MFVTRSQRERVIADWKSEREKRAGISIAHKLDVKTENKTYNWGGKDYALNLIHPLGKANHLPTIFDIHSGGFARGTHVTDIPMDEYLARQGLTVVNIEYPQPEVASYRDTLLAIVAAMREAMKSEWVDRNYLFDMGISAGASYALVVACLSSDAQQAEEFLGQALSDLHFQGIILNHPVVYLTQFYKGLKPAERSVLKKFMFPRKDSLYRLVKDPSGLLHSVQDKLPPIRIIASQGDIKYFYQSQQLIAYLTNQDFKIASQVLSDENLDHLFNVKDYENLNSFIVNNTTANFVLTNSRLRRVEDVSNS